MDVTLFSPARFAAAPLPSIDAPEARTRFAELLNGLAVDSLFLVDQRSSTPPYLRVASRATDGSIQVGLATGDRSAPVPPDLVPEWFVNQCQDCAFGAGALWGGLEDLADDAIARRLAACRRIVKDTVWLRIQPRPGRDRAWWETQCVRAGFRKHPLYQCLTPFESLEATTEPIDLVLQRIPDQALARYPLERLAAERDLHMDMLREPGIRSDAHLARYTLARQFLKPGMVVVDVACGLGYGSATLAAGTDVARVYAVDSSISAIEYASTHYASAQPPIEFRVGDATRLGFLADASVDVAISFETLEHLVNPDALLREFARILKPGGLFIGSVPNLWIDEQGRNPVPFHLHVYDHAQFQAQLAAHFESAALYRQNAGGGWKRPQPRTLREIESGRPSAADQRDAEWWIAVARKPQSTQPKAIQETASPTVVAADTTTRLSATTRIVVLDEPGRHRELFGRVFDLLGVQPETLASLEPDEIVANRPDLILLSREWTHSWRLVSAAARKAGIPVVYVMDGVLEWSYVWNNLSHIRGVGTMLQPLIASDLCVIGQHPARILASWGLASRIHVVGLPRYDAFDRRRVVDPAARPRIVVATARTAGHNVEQQMLVRRALRDLRDWFAANPVAEPVWRIAADLAEDLGVSADVDGSLAEALAQAAALISFPSTCVLEGMMKGIPVAQIDYRSVPGYVAGAWEIRCAEHIPGTVQELLYPPPARLSFQDACLADELELGDASQRLAGVVRAALARRDPYETSGNPADSRGQGHLDYRQIHAELSAFAAAPAALLQYELDAAYNILQRVKQERMDQRRLLLELAESLADQDLDQVRQYAFIDRFAEGQLEAESPGSASTGVLAHDGKSVRTLFLNPPARLTFDVAGGAAGKLAFAVSMHPDVWRNPESGACRFLVEVDGQLLCDATLDPAHDPTDRRWFRFDLAISASTEGLHRFTFATEGVGSNAFRWALWRNPVFTWSVPASAASSGDAITPISAVHRIPAFYQPGRTIA